MEDMETTRYRQWIADYGDPIQPPSLVRDRMYLSESDVKRFNKIRLTIDLFRRLVFFPLAVIAFFQVLSRPEDAGFPVIFWVALVAGMVSPVSGIVMTLFFIPRATPEQEARNQKLYAMIYDKVRSNSLARGLFETATLGGKKNIYEEDLDEVMTSLAQEVRQNTEIGNRNCTNGHTPLCAHRIPAHITQWLASADQHRQAPDAA